MKVTIPDYEYNRIAAGCTENELKRSLYMICEMSTGTYWQGLDFDLRIIDTAKTIETKTIHESAQFHLTAEENYRPKV
jgi:hypothetical protein